MKKSLITLSLCLLSIICFSQTPKDSLRLSKDQLQRVALIIDSVASKVLRSDMAKEERNYSVDRLSFVIQSLFGLYNQQNQPVVAKQPTDKPKTEKK